MDELDQALAKRHNTTPDLLEVLDLSQEDLSLLDDTEKHECLAVVEAAKAFKANLGAVAARAKMLRDKIQAAHFQERGATAEETLSGSGAT